MFVSRSSSRTSSGEPFIVGEAIKWIGLQLLCLYTGLCLPLPLALLAALVFDYFKTAPPFPSSVFWSRVIYVLAVWGYHSTGRLFWKWLKPGWFK